MPRERLGTAERRTPGAAGGTRPLLVLPGWLVVLTSPPCSATVQAAKGLWQLRRPRDTLRIRLRALRLFSCLLVPSVEATQRFTHHLRVRSWVKAAGCGEDGGRSAAAALRPLR